MFTGIDRSFPLIPTGVVVASRALVKRLPGWFTQSFHVFTKFYVSMFTLFVERYQSELGQNRYFISPYYILKTSKTGFFSSSILTHSNVSEITPAMIDRSQEELWETKFNSLIKATPYGSQLLREPRFGIQVA